MKLKPLPGYVLIEPFDEEEVTASGLVMPEKAKEKPAKGKVLRVGGPIMHYEHYIPPDKKPLGLDFGGFPQEHSPVKEGQVIIYHRWSGQDVKEGQKEYKLVKFQDLMGVYE